MPRILSIIACLLGAAGVAAAAGAAHGDARLGSAAQLLMVHAAGSLALLSLRARSRAMPAAVAIMQFGTTLFSADIAMRVFHGSALFPMAAPIGGSLTILSWLCAAGVFVVENKGKA